MFCGMKIPVWRTPLALSQVDQRIPRVPRLDGLMFNLSQVLILALSKCCIISPFTSWSKRKLFAQKSTNCWKLRICYTFWFSLEMGRLKVWGQAGQKSWICTFRAIYDVMLLSIFMSYKFSTSFASFRRSLIFGGKYVAAKDKIVWQSSSSSI